MQVQELVVHVHLKYEADNFDTFIYMNLSISADDISFSLHVLLVLTMRLRYYLDTLELVYLVLLPFIKNIKDIFLEELYYGFIHANIQFAASYLRLSLLPKHVPCHVKLNEY